MGDSAESVRALGLDVDGVLTDGGLYFDHKGREIKRFNVRDGLAIRLWQRLGFEVFVITARESTAVRARVEELGVRHLVQGSGDKLADLGRVLAEIGCSADETGYMGDDWPDLRVLRAVGYPMAPADASPRVRGAARFVATRGGGHGAVRDAVEHLLDAKGLMDTALSHYD